MKNLASLAALSLGIFAGQLAPAQTPAQTPAAPSAARPANATGQCKDGSYSTAAIRAGACRGHNGIKEWYTTAAAPATPPATPTAPVATTPAAKPAGPSPTTQARTQSQNAAQAAGQSVTPPATQSITPPAPPAPAPAAAAAAKKGPAANAANKVAAPGGGPGLVWLNTDSNVYHCPGTTFYGKTKTGSYMSEADAKAKGAHGNHGATCSK